MFALTKKISTSWEHVFMYLMFVTMLFQMYLCYIFLDCISRFFYVIIDDIVFFIYYENIS